MKAFFSQKFRMPPTAEEDFCLPSLKEDIEKTRIALEIAYAGFDNATDKDMIDCYIYEINALLKRYKHLSDLATREPVSVEQASVSPVKALVSHVFG